MDNHSQHSKCDLPSTPRVSDKILEYYQKFGKDRDLKKFMRLYSPVNSQNSQETQDNDCVSLDSCYKRTRSRETISSTNSSEVLAILQLRPLSVCGVTNSKSLPNIDIQGHTTSEKEYYPSNDVIVDVNIEAEGEKEKIFSISTENLKTPKKTFKNTKTQTPESVAKTHRRLEWDSLGDVGYKKSMSATNISTMERSLLREFFKENSVASEPAPSAQAIDEKHISSKHETIKNLKATEVEHGTPPLACSTLVVATESGTKPKMMTQSTSSTSLYEKLEKCVQTSFMKPPTVRTQEVQCTMSSLNFAMEGTDTPSSFEYYSSKSSKSVSSKSSDILLNPNLQKHFKPLVHPFITSITDLLMKRKALGEKNQQKSQHKIHELQTKFEAALNENKENHSHSTIDSSTVSALSVKKQASELDLGIQLICSLIDAKSINSVQKKQLIRDIIKRITSFEAEDKTGNSSTNNSGGDTNTNSSDSQYQHGCNSVYANINNRAKLRSIPKLGVSPINMEQVSTKAKPSIYTANSNHSSNDILEPHRIHHKDKSYYKQLPYNREINDKSEKENNTKVSSDAAAAINKETQSELIKIDGYNVKNKQTESNSKLTIEALDAKCLKTSIEKKINRCTQTSKTCVQSTSTPPDLTTKKFLVSTNSDLNNSNTDAEQPTMREWLNPLTQSEIEYEEKKQIEMRKKAAAQQEKLNKKSKHDCGRVQQISWIENEIRRLECLKHLLLKDKTTTRNSTSTSSLDHSLHKKLNNDSTQTDKLYDTVYSENSSVLSESAEQLIQEIEIILEESHEDVINIKNNTKHTKDRKKETQILYGKDTDFLNKTNTKTKPKLRIINENINFHEEQLLNGKKAEHQKQREKIDTPSTNKSEESESLRDLVQQRKREFMKAYKSKKQHHYEALKQQQKEDFKYLNMQRKSATGSKHYSPPHTLQKKYTPSLTVSDVEPHASSEHVCSTTSAALKKNDKPNSPKVFTTTSANTNNTTTTSSSSMFCMSSDISVPMGSQNSSSTPTTTHQYDDVATAAKLVGVAVQTSDSIKRSKPIYGPSHTFPYTATTFSNTACIQVKPKGIAYVIEFDDNKHDSDLNSGDDLIKYNANSHHANTTQIANNSKPLTPSEPLMTLQEHLEKSKPEFLKRSKEREAILNQLQSMRQERYRELRNIIGNTSLNSLDRRLQHLPPPPIQKVRILNTKEMKALTNKRFSSLPEVVAKQERELEEKKRRTNRILKDVFNRRLQKRVRNGKLSLNHSKTVI